MSWRTNLVDLSAHKNPIEMARCFVKHSEKYEVNIDFSCVTTFSVVHHISAFLITNSSGPSTLHFPSNRSRKRASKLL